MHAAADRLEPTLAARVVRAMARARERVSLAELAGRLQLAQQRFAVGGRIDAAEVDEIVDVIVTKALLVEALAPAGAVAQAAVMAGGRLGAAAVEAAVRA